MSEFHRHVAQSTETDHANFLALRGTPVAHGGVGCDPGTKKRRSPGQTEVGGDAKDEALINDDGVRVAAVVDRSGPVLVRRVVGERHARAELFQASFALRAGAVRINHATDRGEVAGFKLRDR